jgi:two-component system, OmpR family, alkaline phosphatase synthesis response regulator PhoP
MKKILIIDDVVDFAYLVKKNLQLMGSYEVVCAGTGEEGIRLAESQQPSLILLDINMPLMNGFDVMKKLKENKKTSEIPVILLTARHDAGERLEVLHLHEDGYVIKPFTMHELDGKVEAALGGRSSQ